MSKYYFAWVGDPIPALTTLVTTGDTHGGIVETVTTTADTTAGSALLTNVAGANQLVTGQLYAVSGPGIPDGAFLVATGAVEDPQAVADQLLVMPVLKPNLVALQRQQGAFGGDVVMNVSAAASQQSVTLILTKPVTVARSMATLSGTTATLADAAALLPGTLYGIAGAGIPAGALFLYAGSNGVALRDIAGNPLTAGGGTVAVTISGMPNAAANTVTNVASLAGLVGGKRYDISGPGIPANTTFVAPGTGNTITLDQAVTASALAAPLTITGPRVATEPFDPIAHAREDEQVFALTITQREGDFATLDIEIRNPGIGLLNPGRQEWCWLSWDPEDGSGIAPLFTGRLVGIPEHLDAELVRLQFVAQPDDYWAAKSALAATMRTLPYWDPVWLAQGVNDPDTVLEARAQLWHVDRLSLDVTASDIIAGEAGTITIGEDQHFYDRLDLSYRQPPLSAISVSGTVSWTQEGDGEIDLTPMLISKFRDGGSPYQSPLICSLTGDGLKGAWPQPGQSIGAGWSVGIWSTIINADWVQPETYSVTYSATAPTPAYYPSGLTTGAPTTAQLLFSDSYITQFNVQFPLGVYGIYMPLDWVAARQRSETVRFVVTAGLQRLLSQPAGGDQQSLDLSSDYISQAVDAGFAVPLGDLRRRSYFQTERGWQSLQYLVLLARARILARARAVTVSFESPLATVAGITCRHNVTLTDRRLPGGVATGKVIEYELVADEHGERGRVTIGCVIGQGSAAAAVSGTPRYVDDYVDDGYQTLDGETVLLDTGDITIQSLDGFPIDDDGVDLFDVTPDAVVNALELSGGLRAQLTAIAGVTSQSTIYPYDPVTSLRLTPTRIALDLKAMTGVSFHTEFAPAASPLAVPKTIDLEAGASA